MCVYVCVRGGKEKGTLEMKGKSTSGKEGGHLDRLDFPFMPHTNVTAYLASPLRGYLQGSSSSPRHLPF